MAGSLSVSLALPSVEIAPQPLPVGLAEMPPGPELGVVLASIDRTRLGGSDVCVVLAARARQLAHVNAELLADVLEVARTPWNVADDGVRRQEVDDFSAAQVEMTLTMAPGSARGSIHLARDLVERLPEVFESLRVGRI